MQIGFSLRSSACEQSLLMSMMNSFTRAVFGNRQALAQGMRSGACYRLARRDDVLHQSVRVYSNGFISLKDKSFKDIGGGPRKSPFADAEPKIGKVRSDEDKEKLKRDREEREQKKKEIKKRQLEIQKKRNEAKLPKEKLDSRYFGEE